MNKKNNFQKFGLAKIGKKSSFLKIFGEHGFGAQSVYSTKYVVSDKLSSMYKIRAQKYILGDMSQKWIFFDGQKSAKKADFGVFGTFFSLFLKIFQNFNFFQKLCFRAILCKKHVQKGQNDKKIFFVENLKKYFFFNIFSKKEQKKADFCIFCTFLPFFEKF